MNYTNKGPLNTRPLYIPASLGELQDFFYAMIGEAPSFGDDSGYFDQDIDSRFHQLTEGLGIVRKKLGEERYAGLIDLASRAKTLFAADLEETNGKTMEGIGLIHDMMDIVQSTRKRRAATKQVDDEGEVNGD